MSYADETALFQILPCLTVVLLLAGVAVPVFFMNRAARKHDPQNTSMVGFGISLMLFLSAVASYTVIRILMDRLQWETYVVKGLLTGLSLILFYYLVFRIGLKKIK